MAKKKFDMKRVMTKVGGASVGGAVGQASNKVLGKLKPEIGAGVKIVAGAVLPELVKNDFVSEIGSGIIAVGAADLTKKFIPAVAGIGEYDNSLGEVDEDFITDNEYSMSGTEEEDNAIGDIADENIVDTGDGY